MRLLCSLTLNTVSWCCSSRSARRFLNTDAKGTARQPKELWLYEFPGLDCLFQDADRAFGRFVNGRLDPYNSSPRAAAGQPGKRYYSGFQRPLISYNKQVLLVSYMSASQKVLHLNPRRGYFKEQTRLGSPAVSLERPAVAKRLEGRGNLAGC